MEETKDEEESKVTQAQVINDPNCVHDWVFLFVDGDNRKNYGCRKCPMGKVEV